MKLNFHPLAARSYKSGGTAYNLAHADPDTPADVLSAVGEAFRDAWELFDEITDEACIEAATQKAAEEDDKSETVEQKEERGE